MPAPKARSEVHLSLCDTPLRLRFRARNMMVLTELTGKSPIELFERFDGLNQDDVTEVAKRFCDLNFLIPIIVAGLASEPEFKRLDAETIQDRVCDLFDAECTKRGVSLLELTGELVGAVLPAVVESLNVAGSAGGKGNESGAQEPTKKTSIGAK